MTKKRKLVLAVVIGTVLIAATLAAVYFLILQQTLAPIFFPESAPTKESYQNPFANPTQAYENPFSTYQNPFENLK